MKLKNTKFSLLSAGALASFLSMAVSNAGAQGDMTPRQLVDEYLVSLSAGNTDRLSALIDGSMKTNNRQLELSPDTYARFLQTHYDGVVMTVENLSSVDSGMLARVRFEYPNTESSLIDFVLTRVGGQWKITDEKF